MPVEESLDLWSSYNVQIFLVVNVCCLLLLQLSLGKPYQWERDLLILWETWSPAMYCSYSAIIWEMKQGLKFKPRPLTFYTSPTFETPIRSWKLYFDWPVLSAEDLILHKTTLLKLRPVRANSAQHLCKVLNILRAYSSMWKHLSMFLMDCRTSFPGAAAEKYYIKFVLPAAHYYV